MTLNKKKLIKLCNDNFSVYDPFERWTKNKDYLILFETDGYYLTELQYNAIICALKEMKSKCNINLIFTENAKFSENKIVDINDLYDITSLNYEQYLSLVIPMENILITDDNTFSIYISHEMHAVIAGSQMFLALFAEEYGKVIEDNKKFVDFCNNNDISTDLIK